MPAVMPVQLDIFDDSRDVMLRNDVLQALQQRNAAKARTVWQRLVQEYPQERLAADLLTLIELLEGQASLTSAPGETGEAGRLADHAALRQARLHLAQTMAPVAHKVFGPAQAQRWMRPLWQNLAQRADHLPFCAEHEEEHAAPLLLSLQDWPGAAQVIERIPSWRRIPAPLAWMAHTKLQQFGLQAASWPLLAELAWLAPKRLDALVDQAGNPILQRLKEAFELEFDDDAPAPSTSSAPPTSAWFPAWVLTRDSSLARELTLAQPGQHSAPEQAMRLLLEMLGLERQGRQREAVAKRQHLGELHPSLLKCFLKVR
jgi:hypothetical protein